MGLSEPALATPRQQILDPRTGKPVGADDGFFEGLNNELADKGFFVAAADDLIAWARTGSLMWMTFGLACCAVEPGAAPLQPTRPAAARPTRRPFGKPIVVTVLSLMTLPLAVMYRRARASTYRGPVGLAGCDLDIDPVVLACACRIIGLRVRPRALVICALSGARGAGRSRRGDRPVRNTVSAELLPPVARIGLVPLRSATVEHGHLVVPGGQSDAAVRARHPAGPRRPLRRRRRVVGARDHALRADAPDRTLSGGALAPDAE